MAASDLSVIFFFKLGENNMDESLVFSLIDHFSEVVDPRLDRTKKHNVIDIISITIMATISGMQNWIEIVDWSKTNQEKSLQLMEKF